MRRKGTPCACECNPCKGKNYVRAVNNVSPDPNGDLELKAGNGIAISQSGDNQITITNDAIASSFVAGDNIEINPSGDNLEIRVNTSQIVRGSGNIGSDTKPVKVVNGVATEVTNDLQKKMGTVTAANGINLATNTPNFDVVSVTAPISGRAVVNIRGGFANNGAGYRLVGYAKNTTSAQTEWLLNTNSNGDYLYYSVPLIIDVNAGDVIHGCAYQTSGSTLNVSMGITMMIYPM